MSLFTFNFTSDQLKQILTGNQYYNEWYEALCKILPHYDINTPKRVAAFISQCAHESANFRVLKENLNYQASTLTRLWPSLFPPDIAEQYASAPNKQEMIANRAYGNRMGNGPESSGDGWRFCGRGLIQLTGRNNYEAFSNSIGIPVEQISEYLLTYDGAVQSACWFWEKNGLNQLADAGDILTLTKRINGGTIGLTERKKHYIHALHIFDPNTPQEQLETELETVRIGSNGLTVQEVQKALEITVDGNFGPETHHALVTWQTENGLVPDGIAGPLTLKKLIKG